MIFFILKDVYWNKIHLPAINLTLLISKIRNVLYSVRSFVIFVIHDKVLHIFSGIVHATLEILSVIKLLQANFEYHEKSSKQ